MRLRTIITGAALALAVPAAAQIGFSQSYTFLKAIKDSDGTKITEILSKAGSAQVIINTQDQATGDTALHIVTRRRDMTYLNFLLSRGADANLRNKQGQAPLLIATQLRWSEGVSLLLERGALPDLTSSLGETALTRAVQNNDTTIVALLLRSGANPLKAESGSGLSARDYAARDPRAAVILRQIDEAKPKPKSKYGPN
ncbi:hypothetical protein SPAN111604_02580 [Sphingomonas antarctica]|uniref:ankyrin repeat domain-containing protein n=1 Tax=Sphingomonas antarctica TaxID=2040274 RepID=UPI0039ECC849